MNPNTDSEKKCPSCGAEWTGAFSYCPYCSTKLVRCNIAVNVNMSYEELKLLKKVLHELSKDGVIYLDNVQEVGIMNGIWRKFHVLG